MLSVLKKLYTDNCTQAYQDIISAYERQGYVVVHFLYFANIVGEQLFADTQTTSQQQYKRILLQHDFVLPDGMALQLFYFLAKIRGLVYGPFWLANLNGTDFVPYIINTLGPKKCTLLLYGATKAVNEKTKHYFMQQGFDVIAAQDGYQSFDWEKITLPVKKIPILLVARGTPLQEKRVKTHMKMIRQNKLLVFTVGGLFDFLTGTDKRAPKRIRMIKCEWLYRLITNPTKNASKVRRTLLAFWYVLYYLVLKKPYNCILMYVGVSLFL